MRKSIKFKLRNFPSTPSKLRLVDNQNTPKSNFDFDILDLYRHYYLDRWLNLPSLLNISNFEYINHLSHSSDFRFTSIIRELNSAHKRNISFNLGQAFLRYFLYEFCGITYFAHMDKVLNKITHPAFDGMQIRRRTQGDVPDYLCARSVSKPFIGEAKGRLSNISFDSVEFQNWRDQFQRIEILNRNNIPKRLKGYIVATKIVTENNRPSNRSTIYAEDPYTYGEENISEEELGVGKLCIALHYARILNIIGITPLSVSLEYGFSFPQDLLDNYEKKWKSNHPKLEQKVFVGVKVPSLNGHELEIIGNVINLNLYSNEIFIGIDFHFYKNLKIISKGNWEKLADIKPNEKHISEEGFSLFKDGFIIGDATLFTDE